MSCINISRFAYLTIAIALVEAKGVENLREVEYMKLRVKQLKRKLGLKNDELSC